MSSFQTTKSPGAKIKYEFDWSAYLNDDAISSSVWSVTGTDNALLTSGDSSTGNVSSVWLEGGTLNRRYQVKNTITTNSGVIDERTLSVTISQL